MLPEVAVKGFGLRLERARMDPAMAEGPPTH